jgi:hypothetical protein
MRSPSYYSIDFAFSFLYAVAHEPEDVVTALRWKRFASSSAAACRQSFKGLERRMNLTHMLW